MGSSGKSSRAETFLLIFKPNLKRCLPKPSKPQCNSQSEWHLRWLSNKVDMEEDLSGEPGLATSTKVDSNKHRSSNGGDCNKGRNGRVNSPKDLDGNISIRVVAIALNFQYCIPLMI